ncbi:MAG: hypothetical protein PHW13_00560 [Methylococcales bacterium]|nr:hypothetical protein [Methylococcales bacterium]
MSELIFLGSGRRFRPKDCVAAQNPLSANRRPIPRRQTNCRKYKPGLLRKAAQARAPSGRAIAATAVAGFKFPKIPKKIQIVCNKIAVSPTDASGKQTMLSSLSINSTREA